MFQMSTSCLALTILSPLLSTPPSPSPPGHLVAGFRRALFGRFASFGNRPSDNAADRTRRGSIRKLQDETPSPVEGSPAPFAEGSPAPVDDGTPAPEGGEGDGDDEYSGTDENYDDGGYSEEVDPTPAPDGEEGEFCVVRGEFGAPVRFSASLDAG